MITKRTTPRRVVEQWLTEAVRKAVTEKATLTAESLLDTSQAFLAMTASSDEADPDDMEKILNRSDFLLRACRYFEKNWTLNTGLTLDESGAFSEIQRNDFRQAVDQVLEGLREAAGRVTEISGPAITELTETVMTNLIDKSNPLHSLHGEGTGILLREVLGLPGDVAPCRNVTDVRVLTCALRAMHLFGVDVAPEAYESLNDGAERYNSGASMNPPLA
ncbi:hypothetical protein KUV57_13675 [Epibacterium sp. DP7N7-1]|nr:hypothetical protein [Epibacterium sp. DP7N7-1]